MPSKTDVQGVRKMWNKNPNIPRMEGSVAMRLKFYESKNDGRKTVNNPKSTSNYFATTSRMESKMYETKIEEPVYATVNKKNKPPKQTAVIAPRQAISNRAMDDRNLSHRNGQVRQGHNYQREDIEKMGKQHDYKPNGTYFAMVREPEDTQSKERDRVYETIAYRSEKTDKPKFLSANEIEKIYQKSSTRIPKSQTSKTDNVAIPKTIPTRSEEKAIPSFRKAENPTEYQQKIMQSKNALNELRKSLSKDDYPNDDMETNDKKYTSVCKSKTRPSNDDGPNGDIKKNDKKQTSVSKSKTLPNGVRLEKTKVSQVFTEHGRARKQDSNNSTVSNSSTMSKKLLTLTENKKPTSQKSEKSSSKKFSWRINSSLEDTDFESDYVKKSPRLRKKEKEIQRKRHTISSMEYTLADISPASIRSNRSHQDNNKNLQKTKSADFNVSRPPTLDIPTSSHTLKTLKQTTPKSDRTSTPSSASSMMQGESKLVFKVDLDEPYSEEKVKEQEQGDLVLYREHGIYIPVKARNVKRIASKNKSLNKWIQTDGPPIRPPKSRTYSTQTGINPCMCVSKRLQARPCYIPDYLASQITQTVSKETTEMGTQTHQKRVKSQTSQTQTRRYRNMNSQTPAPPETLESSVQAVMTSKTIEVQTEDEDSDIWGNNVSLDRLIRSGAMKRSRSFGHGIRGSMEKIRDRSASIDGVSDKKNAASSSTESTQQNPQQELEITGKITTYSWSEKGKFVKMFVSYSGIHLIPSKNISVKTNGINLHLTIVEETATVGTEATQVEESKQQAIENRALTSTLHLQRLRRPIVGLTYNVQRDMITIMLRKQKQTLWTSLTFQNKFVI